MKTFNIKEEVAPVELTWSREHPIAFNKGYQARAQGLNNTIANKQEFSPQNAQIWTDGWITKDYELWLDSKLDLLDWLEKNDRELK